MIRNIFLPLFPLIPFTCTVPTYLQYNVPYMYCKITSLENLYVCTYTVFLWTYGFLCACVHGLRSNLIHQT